ncbi:MAG: LamG domain-containing protein [Nostoc sp.]|uniref:LamG domain-containing protein n=1 Tax=Nostoc sp. TaxID=1180 RepID=UPI002FF3F4E4
MFTLPIGFFNKSSNDPYFSSVVLLLPFTGTNGSSTFTEVKGNAVTVDGTPTISNAQTLFGNNTGSFNGVNQALNFSTNVTSLDLSGDFTIEAWVYIISFPHAFQQFITMRDPSGNPQYSLYLNGSNQYSVEWNNNSSTDYVVSGPTATTGAWVFVAGVKASNVLSLYVNGNSVGTPVTTSGTANLYSNRQLWIGGNRANNNQNFYGYYGGIRVSTYARYTSNFTPPTSPFPTS